MKKLIILLLCVGLFLTACSSNETETGPPPDDFLMEPPSAGEPQSLESYLSIDENEQTEVLNDSVVTLSLKVDTAAYTNIQRYINNRSIPPVDAVKTEEMINFFPYEKELVFNDSPFAIDTEVAPSPFDANKQLAFIRIKTEDIHKSDLPPSNFTFLIDTSGSMNSYDKLPLLKESFAMLTDALDPKDRISIVTYAGTSEVVLDGARGDEKNKINKAVQGLKASGSTAGGNAIMTAYELAEKNFIEGGNNRIILASDGDFNVGISDLDSLEHLISNKRDTGVYLSVLGFGAGNIRDDIMETLAKNGNGNYSYINSTRTAKKVLVDEIGTNLFTIANDVKAQIEFNPYNIKNYRLIGYENRQLANRDFNDDTKDAGEIGAGTDVVILFELELAESNQDLKYQPAQEEIMPENEFMDELFEVRLRYKNPLEDESQLLVSHMNYEDMKASGSTDFNFAASVAAFGDLLRSNQFNNANALNKIIENATDNLGTDQNSYRLEFISDMVAFRNYAY